jgi:hypothetical protein
MIQRRAADAGIKTRISNHTLRATGITAYLKNNGTLQHAQYLANHESPPAALAFLSLTGPPPYSAAL